MESLRVLHANGIAINDLLSTTGEVKTWHSFILNWGLVPRKSPELSWTSLLPSLSLVRLNLSDCGRFDDVFPKDLSNLSSVRILNLSGNPICSLPDCIKCLTRLEKLQLNNCRRLKSIVGLQKLKCLEVIGKILLEKINSVSPGFGLQFSNCRNILEITSYFKLEPLGTVEVEIKKKLGLFDLCSIGEPNIKFVALFGLEGKKLRPQVCHEMHIFYVYLPGRVFPTWFSLKNTGSSISFIVPSHLNSLGIQGISVCFVYAFSNNPSYAHCKSLLTIVSNTTKGLIWSQSPLWFALPKAQDEDMTTFSYWNFRNQLEADNKHTISVTTREGLQVKEVGVRLVYKKDQNDGEVFEPLERPFGNVVPGVSAQSKFT